MEPIDAGRISTLEPSRAAASAADAGDAQLQALADAARQFEALFLEQMLASMRDTLPEDGLMRGRDEDVYHEMLDRELARSIVEGQGYGLAETLVRQLTQRDSDALGASEPRAPRDDALQAYRSVRDSGGIDAREHDRR